MKMLIVDDEFHIRKGLQDMIDWSQLGMKEVFVAANGEDAIRLFEQQKPAIVITDIMMPEMDGIELSEVILQSSPETKIIVLSGYGEFDYAQRAIQLGVFGYELKPVSISKLVDLVKNAMDDFLREQQKLASYKKFKVMQVFKGEKSALSEAHRLFQDLYNFDITHPICLLALEIDDFYKRTDPLSLEETEGIESAVADLIRVSFDTMENVVIRVSENLFIVNIQVEEYEGEHQFTKNLEVSFQNLNTHVQSSYDMTMSGGISSRASLKSINILYQEALQALEFKFYKGKSNLLRTHEVVHPSDISFFQTDESELIELIEKLHMNEIRNWLRSKYQFYAQDGMHSKQMIKQISFYYITLLIRVINEKFKYFEKMLLETIRSFEQSDQHDTLEGYLDWVLQVYQQVIDGIIELNGIKQNKILALAVDYIQEHYMEDLSVMRIAEHVNKTPNYFSHLFKKEYGISFSEYVNKVRIQQAKRQLINTDQMIYEIAEQVGYKDYKHFTQVFKKFEDCTPTEYRNNKKQASKF